MAAAGVLGGAAVAGEVELSEGRDITGAERSAEVEGAVEGFVAPAVDLIVTPDGGVESASGGESRLGAANDWVEAVAGTATGGGFVAVPTEKEVIGVEMKGLET